MLFSATMPHGVHDLASRITKDAVWVEAAPSGTKAEGITELVYSVKPEMKPDLLLRLLEAPEWEQVLIFTRTKAGADALKARLDREGIRTEALHSNLRMANRTRALERFAEKKVRVLVATDIAQRGLDVEGISHVVNYDVPKDPEDYTHRIGRTAQGGRRRDCRHVLGRGRPWSVQVDDVPYREGPGAHPPSQFRLRRHAPGGVRCLFNAWGGTLVHRQAWALVTPTI